MKKLNLFLIFILVIGMLCCGMVYAENLTGTWVGKTSQEYNLTLKIEMVNGSPTVTQISYKIKMYASSWSCTTELNQPKSVSAKIVDNKFSYSGSDFSFSGSINNDVINGVLEATNVHPQGLGTAYGQTTFSLKKDTNLL
jgi:hypothetical protein